VHLFRRVGIFTEDRVNGKIGEVNDTTGRPAAAASGSAAAIERTPVALFVDRRRRTSTFLAVTTASTRQRVRLATDQHVPTNGSAAWCSGRRRFGTMNAFSAGLDWRWVDGDSQEDAYVAARPASCRRSHQAGDLRAARHGGTQQSQGLFVQDIFTPTSKVVIT
jgi:hypothetical protein